MLRRVWRLWRLRKVQREIEVAELIRRWAEEDPSPSIPVSADPPSELDTPSRP